MTSLSMFKCGTCLVEFKRKPREKGRPAPKFCSSKCFGVSISKKRYCLECKKEILYNSRNKRKNKKFCSKSCAITSRKKGVPGHVRAKISKAKSGNALSPLHRQALTGVAKPSARGESHHSYKNGEYLKEKYRQRTRVEYKNWRRAVLERDGYKCTICGEEGGAIEVDHIKPWCTHRDLRYDVSNGRAICRQCHLKTETHGIKARSF